MAAGELLDIEGWQDVLNASRVEIGAKMDLEPVVRDLRAKEVITVGQAQQLNPKYMRDTPDNLNDVLIEMITKKTDKHFRQFLEVLRSDPVGSGELADLLEDRIRERRAKNIEKDLEQLEAPPQDNPPSQQQIEKRLKELHPAP